VVASSHCRRTSRQHRTGFRALPWCGPDTVAGAPRPATNIKWRSIVITGWELSHTTPNLRSALRFSRRQRIVTAWTSHATPKRINRTDRNGLSHVTARNSSLLRGRWWLSKPLFLLGLVCCKRVGQNCGRENRLCFHI